MHPWRPMRFMRTAWILLALTVLLVSAGCAGSSASKSAPPKPTSSSSSAINPAPPVPTSSPTSGVGPTPITGLLAPAPTNCLPAAPPQTLTGTQFGGSFGAGFIGSSPVWQLGIGSTSAIQLDQDGADPLPSTKVLWLIGPNYHGVVTLGGRNLSTGAPIWFDIYPNNSTGGSDVYTTRAQLNPANPNRGSTSSSRGTWNIWGIGLIFLSAGCYELDVSWTGGSWRSINAVGR